MGLCRFCSGYGWEWVGKDNEKLADINIEGINIKWNGQTEGWLSNVNAREEMGSVYSLSGLDLNYTGVVIGPDLYWDKETEEIKVNKERYYDNKVKRGTSDKELKKYVLNTYGVLFTRGMRGTYIYVCDKELREYFKRFISMI